MIQHIFSLLLLLLYPGLGSNKAELSLVGISTSQQFTAEELVRDKFIRGQCQNVSNISPIGNASSWGHFSGGLNVIGFEEGIILSSGDIALAAGPNESPEASARFNNNTSDPDLEIFATNIILDPGGIEFDFVPIVDTVSFRYVFASEEYCEFVNSIFNDVFGFFVSGPGINGPYANKAINVATLPNSDEFVSINNVNYLKNADSYIKNELQVDARKCGIDFNPQYPDLIEYDGFTIPLTATFGVIPCETYHIRLVVADVGDDKLDSAVFLESKSFNLGQQVSVRAEVPDSPEPTAVEACRDGQFVFDRTGLSFSDPLTINFNIHSESSALNGVDFESIPNQITIPAGEITATLPIQIISDTIEEFTESLRLELEVPCECETPNFSTLLISDGEDIEVFFDEVEVCANQEFSIGPRIIGGAAPYEYEWVTGDRSASLTTIVEAPRHYEVTITDACGRQGFGLAGIDIQSTPNLEVLEDIAYCEGIPSFLRIAFEGNAPWSFSYTIDAGEVIEVDNIFENPYLLPVYEVGEYEITSFNDRFCRGQIANSGRVIKGGAQINYSIRAPSCFDTFDGGISLGEIEGEGPFQIEWSPSVDSLGADQLQAGTYQIKVTDASGCESIEIIELQPTDSNCQEIEIGVPNAFSPNNDGINDRFQIYVPENNPIEQIESLLIFNRWGGKVYEKFNFPTEDSQLWDGKINSTILEVGIYVWQITVKLNDGQTKVLAGEISLIR